MGNIIKHIKLLSLNVFFLIFIWGGNSVSQTCFQPPEGLISWWPGDGNAYDIISGNTGVLQNSATFDLGKVEQAFSLVPGAYVQVPHDPSLNPETITVEVWFKRNSSYSYFDPIVKKAGEGTSDNRHGYALEFLVNNVIFWVYVNGWYHSSYTFIPLGVWTHVVGVYDGFTVKLYVNGNLIGSPTPIQGSIAPSGNNLNIGRDPNKPDRLFDGLIDEVSIYNRALSAEEISALYQSGASGKCKSNVFEVEIDIKPGSDPNSINLDANGVIPVAILTIPDFDASTVDPFSVCLEGASVRVKGKSGKAGSIEDVDDDGDLDLVVQVYNELELQEGITTATLTGVTYDGVEIVGTDDISVVPPSLGKRSVDGNVAFEEMTFELLPNYPNPFNPETIISYTIPERTHVVVDIYNIKGNKITTLINEQQNAGYHSVTWNGCDESSNYVSGGIYMYRIKAGNFYKTHRMLLLK